MFAELRGNCPPWPTCRRQRWFGGKARRIHSTEIVDLVPLQTGEADAYLFLSCALNIRVVRRKDIFCRCCRQAGTNETSGRRKAFGDSAGR